MEGGYDGRPVGTSHALEDDAVEHTHTHTHTHTSTGHRIKNPDAGVTVIAKQLHTVHRLVLSGAPIQNKLAELWSIFDFVLPGRLGDLSVFEANFAQPISAGGWTHATPLQVATAQQTALVLRDTIGPYLLRRLKRDVNAHLPSKTEQVGGSVGAHCRRHTRAMFAALAKVLFCRLAPAQRSAYLRFIQSHDVTDILESRAPAFRAITILRAWVRQAVAHAC